VIVLMILLVVFVALLLLLLLPLFVIREQLLLRIMKLVKLIAEESWELGPLHLFQLVLLPRVAVLPLPLLGLFIDLVLIPVNVIV